LEVEWDEFSREPKVESIVPFYHKTDILGLQAFLWDEFNLWAGNGSCVEKIQENFKDIIFEALKRNVPQQILSKNPDPEYNNKGVKRLKAKVMKMYNKENLDSLTKRK
jgi:hypothetical protein